MEGLDCLALRTFLLLVEDLIGLKPWNELPSGLILSSYYLELSSLFVFEFESRSVILDSGTIGEEKESQHDHIDIFPSNSTSLLNKMTSVS